MFFIGYWRQCLTCLHPSLSHLQQRYVDFHFLQFTHYKPSYQSCPGFLFENIDYVYFQNIPVQLEPNYLLIICVIQTLNFGLQKGKTWGEQFITESKLQISVKQPEPHLFLMLSSCWLMIIIRVIRKSAIFKS